MDNEYVCNREARGAHDKCNYKKSSESVYLSRPVNECDDLTVIRLSVFVVYPARMTVTVSALPDVVANKSHRLVASLIEASVDRYDLSVQVIPEYPKVGGIHHLRRENFSYRGRSRIVIRKRIIVYEFFISDKLIEAYVYRPGSNNITRDPYGAAKKKHRKKDREHRDSYESSS